MSITSRRRRRLKTDLDALHAVTFDPATAGERIVLAVRDYERRHPPQFGFQEHDADEGAQDGVRPPLLERHAADGHAIVQPLEQLVHVHSDSPSVRATRPESASAGPRTVGAPADAPRTPSRRVGGLGEYFTGAREGREDAAPATGPRHARRAPKETFWTIAAGLSIGFFAVVVAITLYGYGWAS